MLRGKNFWWVMMITVSGSRYQGLKKNVVRQFPKLSPTGGFEATKHGITFVAKFSQ